MIVCANGIAAFARKAPGVESEKISYPEKTDGKDAPDERKMKTYSTLEAARSIGIHPNTVRMYEQWGLIPKAERKANGYRVFTDFHLEQLRLVRVAFRTEVLQNGLRTKITEAVKASAKGEFDRALSLTESYRLQTEQEIRNAAEAIRVVQRLVAGTAGKEPVCMRRREVSDYLGISVDTLRSWERNGLLRGGRKQSGYRVYTGEDIDRLLIVRALRCSHYSLESILRMLNALEQDPQADMDQALNTPGKCADIISVCDRLIVSLQAAGRNAGIMTGMLADMKSKFSNPPL